MPELKGTRTEKHLLMAFAGESQAMNRYTYAASVARKEGYVQVSNIFLETAANEQQHAKRFFKLLEGGMVEITATFPAGVIGDTVSNLESAAAGENEEWAELYPMFADVAKEEGFPAIASVFRMVARAEQAHETRFRKLVANILDGKVFEKDEPVRWKCDKCGYIHDGTKAPKVCPACDHPQSHFEVFEETY